MIDIIEANKRSKFEEHADIHDLVQRQENLLMLSQTMNSLQSVYSLFPGKYVEHMVFNESLNIKVENIYYHLQYSLRLWKNHSYDT